MKISRKKFVKEWVKALRSRKFKQTTGKISTMTKCKDGDYGYCCLGVACVVGEKMGIRGAGFTKGSYDARGEGGPSSWFSDIMGSDDPILDDTKDISCIDANDKLNWKFGKIATALEKKYL